MMYSIDVQFMVTFYIEFSIYHTFLIICNNNILIIIRYVIMLLSLNFLFFLTFKIKYDARFFLLSCSIFSLCTVLMIN